MSSPYCPKPIAFQLRKLSAAVTLTLLFSASAGAAGWGDLTVLSALGQPLRAEIELVSTSRQEDGPLTVKLASADAYRQANIEFNPALMSLRFAVEERGGRQFVRITSTQPLNEPFVDMLLELRSSSGRMVREYVFLLDPADLGGTQMAVVAPVHGDAMPSPPASSNGAASAAKPAAGKVAQKPARVAASPRPAKPQAANNKQPTGAAGAKPRLTLSSVTATSATDDKAGVIVLEDYATMEKSVAEANARVKALEQKVADLQKLLEVTNSLLAELQKQNELAKAGAASAQAAVPAAAEAKPAEQTAPVAEAAPAPAQPKPAQPKPPAPPPVAEPDSGTYLLPGAALLVSLLGAAGLYIARRRKAKKPFEATLFHETAGDKTAQHASAAESAATMLGTGILAPAAHGLTEADPLAEADVYIAYGRDVQAEDILKEALRKQPDRHPVRVKLLSIYAGRKDLQSFETFARELHGMTQGEGEDWKQAAELGREIDPGNPLYAASRKEPVHPPAPVPEPELVIERIDGEAPADAFAAAEAPQDIPLPELAPTEEITPVALEPAPDDVDFDLEGMIAEAAPASAAPAEATPVETVCDPGPGPIDFDFLKPDEPVQESLPAIAELPTAALGEPQADPNMLDFDFLKQDGQPEAVPEIPTAVLEVPTEQPKPEAGQDETLLDFDFLKPDAAVDAASEDGARKAALQPNT